MTNKRFLRDRILDDMIDDIQFMSDKLPVNECQWLVNTQLNAFLSDLFQVNKKVLERLETLIEEKRNVTLPDDVIVCLVKTASDIQSGLVSVRRSIKEGIEGMTDGIQDFLSSFDASNGEGD